MESPLPSGNIVGNAIVAEKGVVYLLTGSLSTEGRSICPGFNLASIAFSSCCHNVEGSCFSQSRCQKQFLNRPFLFLCHHIVVHFQLSKCSISIVCSQDGTPHARKELSLFEFSLRFWY